MSRRSRHKEEPGLQVSPPITPMLDMSFQLLAFFVITFKPPSSEGQISMKLPAVEEPPNNVAVPQEKLDIPEEKDEDYTVVLTQADGALGSIAVKTTTSVTDIPSDDPKKLELLMSRLKELYQNQQATKRSGGIKIEADPDLRYSQLVTIMDIARRAGFSSIGVAEPAKEKPKK